MAIEVDPQALPDVATEAAERTHAVRRYIGASLLALSIGGVIGGIKGSYDAAFTPTEVQLGPHQATVQLTHDHEKNYDLGPLGNMPKQVNWLFDTGVLVRVKGIPAPPAGTSTSEMVTNLRTQYTELASSKHTVDATKHEFITRVWHDGLEGGIVGGAAGLSLLWLGVGAWSQMSEKRRQGFRDALSVDPVQFRKVLLYGGLSGAMAMSGAGIVVGMPGHHITQNVDHELDGTPLQGFAVHGEELKLVVDTVAPAIFNEVDLVRRYYSLIAKNFDNAFHDKFGNAPLDHKNTLWIQGLSDNHCNIGMDQVHGDVARKFDVDLTINTGDMTWSGSEAEGLCVAEEAAAIVSHNPEAVVAGNHDGPAITKFARKYHMTVIENDQTTVVGKFKLLGEADVNESTFNTPIHLRGKETVADEAQKIKEAACAQHPDIVIAHEESEAMLAAESGCAPETRFGHDHAYKQPTIVNEVTGSYTMDAGTSGGAKADSPTVLKLQKIATENVCGYVATTRRLIGCYVISATPDGMVQISDFQPAPVSPASATKPPVLAAK